MALSNTAQPINTSLRKIAVVVATAVAGMSAYAHAAETPKKKKPLLLLPHRLRRRVPGGLRRRLLQGNPQPGQKLTPLYRKFHSQFLW